MKREGKGKGKLGREWIGKEKEKEQKRESTCETKFRLRSYTFFVLK